MALVAVAFPTIEAMEPVIDMEPEPEPAAAAVEVGALVAAHEAPVTVRVMPPVLQMF